MDEFADDENKAMQEMKYKKFLPHLSILTAVILLGGLFVTINASRENQDRRSRAAETSGSYQVIGQATGIPNINSMMVGPGETSGSQKFYLSYGSIKTQLVTIDPANNYQATAYDSPITYQTNPWGMTIGSDNNIYLGGATQGPGGVPTPSAHLLKFDTVTKQFVDAGTLPVDPTSSANQTFLWELTSSPIDNNVYGCTSPSANLIKYEPATGTLTTIGRIDSVNTFLRYCVADKEYPYIYMGLGSTNQKIMAFNIQTKAITTLASSTKSNFASVYLGADNKVYGTIVLSDGTTQKYLLNNGTATPATPPAAMTNNTFSNGDKISVSQDNSTILVSHPDGTKNDYPYTYKGGPVRIWGINSGPDGNVYFGTTFPIYLQKFSPSNPSAGFTNLGRFGGGEIYSMLSYKQKLAMLAYGGTFPLATYDPSLPLSKDANGFPSCNGTPQPQNPECTTTITNWGSGITSDFRNNNLIAAPDGNLYAGTLGHYGELNGAVIKWNPDTKAATAYHPYPNLGITALSVANNCKNIADVSYCLVGATSYFGGSGTTPTETNSPLFIWNTSTNSVAQTIPIPNIPNAKTTISLITHPSNNYVYGIVEATDFKQYLFIFNPTTGTFINGGTLLDGFKIDRDYNYNALAIGSDNNIWGMGSTGVFKIDIQTGTANLISTAPEKINTAGFTLVKDAVNGDKIYFATGANLYVYTAPLPDIVWTNLVNTSTNDNTLIKSGTLVTWDAGATSSQVIQSGNGYAELTITNSNYVTTDNRWMFGLNHNNTTASYTDIDYAFYFIKGKVQIFENGGLKSGYPETTFALGDTFRVSIENNKVTYYKNKTAIYTSSQVPTYPLFADTSILHPNIQIAGKIAGATTFALTQTPTPAPTSMPTATSAPIPTNAPTPTLMPTSTPTPTNIPTPTPSASVNLARNKPVTAGSTYSSTYAGSKAVDGNTGTYWISKSTNRWITVDLGALKNVSKFVIKHYTGTYITKAFSIQTSSDNANWSTVTNVTNNTASTTTHTIPTRSARYIKLNIVTPAQNTYPYAFIRELEIY